MRRLSVLSVVALLAVASCSSPSKIDPDATVVISGRALDPAGAPLAGTEVLVFKSTEIGDALFGAVLTVGTLGAVCLVDAPPAICDKAHHATTDADGRYRLELTGADTQGMLGTEATLNVVVTSGDDGPSTTLSFAVRETSVTLPDARLWAAVPTVAEAGGQIHLTYPGLPAEVGSDPTYSAQLYTADREAALWSQPASSGEAVVDARVVEDKPVTVAINGRTKPSGGSGAGSLEANHLSARVPLAGTAGPPPSRGRPCAAVIGLAPAAVLPDVPCGAADGELTAPARLSSGGPEVVTGAVLDLGTARPVHLVVVRGVAGPFVAELSTDGTTFATVATQSGTAVAVAPPGAPGARFVRVRGTTGLDQSLLGEISVW